MKTVISLFLLLFALSGCNAGGLTSQSTSISLPQAASAQPGSESDAQIQGKLLRKEIEKIYAESDLAHRSPQESSQILRKFAERYISAGSRFDYSKAILHSAGFDVNTDPGSTSPSQTAHYTLVEATLTLDSSWIGHGGPAIFLYPAKEENFSVIGRTETSFFITTL